ncbi:MAG: Ppx/GppA phosphatase family protein [Inquilinaceae bacterium]
MLEPAALSQHGEPRARRRPGRWADRYAAVDLGTNNCRLLVALPTGQGFRVIDSFSRQVRLGEGVAVRRTLASDAMDRTLQALRVCAQKIRRSEAVHVRAVATEACRRAANFNGFRDRVLQETGMILDLITSQEEARLAVAGCAPLLDPTVPRALMFDIGGGSTELMWVSIGPEGPLLIDGISLPVGVVNLAERHGGDLVSVETYETIVETVGRSLADFEARHGIAARLATGEAQMLGSSGTVTVVAGVFLDLPRYDRSRVDGLSLETAHALAVSRRLLTMDKAARAAHPCIGRDRADLVVGGCAVLEAICRLWPARDMRVADRGVREGILLDLMAGRPARRARPASRKG